MSQAHHERNHAQWSASATARNWQCAGAIAMSTLAGEERESEYAARGTACHEISEQCLQSGGNAIAYLGEKIKTKQHEIEIDEQIVEGAQFYIDYVRSLKSDRLIIEEQFMLTALSPSLEAGGTCDAVSINYDQKMVEVVDLKFGTHAVDVNENRQCRTYALMVLLELDGNLQKIDTIKSTIVQPRAYHKDGKIRSETYHVADLLQWGADLLKAMARSKQALDEFKDVGQSQILFEEWGEKWLQVGACVFCPAAGFCPKLRKDALRSAPETMREWFDNTSDETPLNLSNMPLPQSPELLGHILDGLDALENWITAVRARAHAEAEHGVKIPNWMLVDKIGNRTWLDETKTVHELYKLGLTAAQVWTKKIISPAQADKLLKKGKDKIKDLYENPIRGTNLVRADKTSRMPAKPVSETFFEMEK